MAYIVLMILLLAFTLGGVFVLPRLLNLGFAEADLGRNEAARLRAQETRALIARSAFIGFFVIVGASSRSCAR